MWQKQGGFRLALDKKIMIEGLTRLFKDADNPLGVDVLNYPDRFKSLVSDFIGGDLYKLERQIILFAYEAGICPQILKAHKADDKERSAFKHIMFRTFTEKLRKRDDDAALAVGVYATALGWKTINIVYELKYDPNGGTGAPLKQNGSGVVTLSTVVPSKPGFAFLGWSASKTATTQSYAKGSKYTLNSNVILYAVWQKKALYEPKGTIIIGEQCWDVVKFGKYEWIVLYRNADRMFLLTKDIVERQSFNTLKIDAYWASSSLRTYLNDEFFHSFSAEEQALVIPTKHKNYNIVYAVDGGVATDYIFLLSLSEAIRSFGGKVDLSEKIERLYAKRKNGKFNVTRIAKHRGTPNFWWLRSPGNSTRNAAFISSEGALGSKGGDVTDEDGGVRPALWLNLSK